MIDERSAVSRSLLFPLSPLVALLVVLLAALLVGGAPAFAQESKPVAEPVEVSPVVTETTDWPSFRGPQASGVAEGFPTATEWNVESGENIRWRTEIPGLSHSCAVIWGNRLFVTTAIRLDGEQELRVGLYGDPSSVRDDSAYAFELYCLDKKTGEFLWEATAWEGVPTYDRHPKGSYAAPSPACDGKRVVAFYGDEGIYCFDLEGELQWGKDLGDLNSGPFTIPEEPWGMAASPILHDDRVIVQCDVQDQSFLVVLDATDGEEVWRVDREEISTWSTPTVDVRDGRSQIICNGYQHIGGYDFATGRELWKLVGGGDAPVPTPILSHDLIFITNAHGTMAPIYAIEAGAEGTLTIDPKETPAMVWSTRQRGNYMQTPIAYGEEVYFCRDNGALSCYDLAGGDEIYRERLGNGRTGFTASAVAADGKLYFCSEEGTVYVLAAGYDFEILATNELGEECMSTAAISEGVLYYRGRSHLVAIEEK